MWPFGVPAATSDNARLNQLETRLQRLELDNAERQIAVMKSMEKVLYQLRARDAKRVRDSARQDAAGQEIEDELISEHPPQRARTGAAAVRAAPPTEHLSRRFRVGGG